VIVTLCPDQTIRELVFEASPERTPGLHLSDILTPMARDIAPKRYDESKPMDWNRVETGFAFERVLEMAFMARRAEIFRPGEVVKDGIIMSPDGIDPDGWVLEEFKATWMSDFDAPTHPKFVKWFWQIKSYALALETTRARLRGLFINGNYREGFSPVYHVWDLQFTERELEENWQMILNNARSKGLL
jgi:hypothetical protein